MTESKMSRQVSNYDEINTLNEERERAYNKILIDKNNQISSK